MGKTVISVIARAGYNDEILSSRDRRYKRFLQYILLISLTVFEIIKKTVFEKSLSGARGRKNVLAWVKTRLKYLS